MLYLSHSSWSVTNRIYIGFVVAILLHFIFIQGCGPYILASTYYNYRFILKVTHSFILNVL